jgi:hypothetical protein
MKKQFEEFLAELAPEAVDRLADNARASARDTAQDIIRLQNELVGNDNDEGHIYLTAMSLIEGLLTAEATLREKFGGDAKVVEDVHIKIAELMGALVGRLCAQHAGRNAMRQYMERQAGVRGTRLASFAVAYTSKFCECLEEDIES